MGRTFFLNLVVCILFAVSVNSSPQSVNIQTAQKDSAHYDNLLENDKQDVIPHKMWPAIFAFLSACLVGLSGIVPLLILPSLKPDELKEGDNARKLKRLLSFAVGGLLGDVFLHLLPESWDHIQKSSQDGTISSWTSISNGLWVLFGLISFCMLEKLFPSQIVDEEDENHAEEDKLHTQMNGYNCNENNNNCSKHIVSNGVKPPRNGYISKPETPTVKKENPPRIKTSGYLNLLANGIDNFTHGLAVGGSYLVSSRVGMLTTLAILLHEIPHEVGDFAILLRAGFSRFQAVKLQLLTATGGILGALVAFLAETGQSAGDQVSWILPFTSGGFIYVALCTVVPDILQESSPRESIIQIFYLLFAVAIVHGVSYIG